MWCNLIVRVALTVGLCVSVCAVLLLAQVARDRLPGFMVYEVHARFQGALAKPRFTNPPELRPNHRISDDDLLPDLDERYRGSVSLDARQGPNFAGQHTIAQWSCGTSCSSSVVVDARTGQLYRDTPYGTLVTSGNPESKDHQYAGLLFRLDSSLLIVEGCFDVDERDSEGKPVDCNRSYYNWVPPPLHAPSQSAVTCPPVPEALILHNDGVLGKWILERRRYPLRIDTQS